jgi:hypothetical protein
MSEHENAVERETVELDDLDVQAEHESADASGGGTAVGNPGGALLGVKDVGNGRGTQIPYP